MTNPRIIFVVLLVSVIGNSVHGKTLHVEKWGDDAAANGCGAASAPCETINHAIDLATRNDRIRVGPGIYQENVFIDVEGLKLESRAGRFGTAIWAANEMLPAVIINQSRVQFGKRGKGFTVHRSTTDTMFSTAAGVLAYDAHNLKLEGNQALENRVGLILSGDRIQVRHNIIVDNDQEGLICTDCPRANIAQNRITGNFRALQIENSPALRLDRNYMAGNSLSAEIDAGATNSTISHNVSVNNVAESMRISTVDGVFIRGNIAAILRDGFTQDNGLSASQSSSPPQNNAGPLRVEHNLALGFDGSGLSLRDFVDARIQNNHALQNANPNPGLGAGIALNPDANADTVVIQRNATYENGSTCGIRNSSSTPLALKKHFLASDMACGPLTLTGVPQSKPATLNINRARLL